jgi:hypothetical protein
MGRPSLGCRTCRKRKIKCDLAVPACGNCKKAGWCCDGYSSTIDLILRDESRQVIQKARAARRRPRRRDCETSLSKQSSLPQSTQEESSSASLQDISVKEQRCQVKVRRQERKQPSPCLGSFLATSLDELAVCYFAANYLYFLDPSDTLSLNDGNGCLLAAVRALGAAGLTRSESGPSAPLQTRQKYIEAIQLSNSALQSDKHVRLDSTLLAVNILGLVENITGFSQSSAWHDHIAGGAALLRLRGPKQFETATGGLLYTQMASNLVMSCVQRGARIPSSMFEIQLEAERQIPDPSDNVWLFYVLSLRFAEVNAAVQVQQNSNTAGPLSSLLRDSIGLDNDLVDFINNLPEDWRPEIVCNPRCDTMPGYLFIYKNFFSAQITNMAFSFRIMLLTGLWKVFRNANGHLILDNDVEARIRGIPRTILGLQHCILASVSQHLGVDKDPSAQMHGNDSISTTSIAAEGLRVNWCAARLNCNPFRSRRREERSLPFVRMAGGYMIQWPLYVAGWADEQGGNIRNRAIQILGCSLGEQRGLQQAVSLAECLRTGGDASSSNYNLSVF